MVRYVFLYFFVLIVFGIIFKFPFRELLSKLGIKVHKNSSVKPTLFDVRDCLVNGEKDMAVKLYRKIYQTSLSEAKKSIEELERNIGEKNP